VLLYALKDIDYWQDIDKDPYGVAVEGLTAKEARDLNKLLMLTALNAKSRDAAVRAFRNKMNKDPDMKAMY
tara:strand:+ start:534 stop:746 length:213 start_codon:yes stop_codon:yes gene_type:complete